MFRMFAVAAILASALAAAPVLAQQAAPAAAPPATAVLPYGPPITLDQAKRVMAAAEASKATYSKALVAAHMGPIATEIRDAPPFYFAEDYHQQYLAKNPYGYCGLGGTGVACQIGTGARYQETGNQESELLTPDS